MNSVGGFGIANVDIIFGNADRIPKAWRRDLYAKLL